HFIDLEDYQNKPLPETRWKAIALLIELKQDPEKAGMLPWAILENYDRLSCAFYDYREALRETEEARERVKNDPSEAANVELKDRAEKLSAVQAKCLVYAGILAHLTGDAVMPLHTTRDFDGRKGADGKMRQRGIHAKIDAAP